MSFVATYSTLEKDLVKELLEIKIRFGKTISGVYSVKILRFRIRIHRAMLADEIGSESPKYSLKRVANHGRSAQQTGLLD